MESAELGITELSKQQKVSYLETETGQSNRSNCWTQVDLGSEATQIDAGGIKFYKKVLLMVNLLSK